MGISDSDGDFWRRHVLLSSLCALSSSPRSLSHTSWMGGPAGRLKVSVNIAQKRNTTLLSNVDAVICKYLLTSIAFNYPGQLTSGRIQSTT